MGKFVLEDASVTINSVNLSDHVRRVTINYEAETPDSTCMNSTGARDYVAGYTNWTADIEFAQDYAAGSVDATLFSLVGGAAVTCVFKPTSAAVSATNPSFTGSALVASYPPISGAAGDFATATVRLRGTGTLTRATS